MAYTRVGEGSYMFAIMVAKENAILALCAASQYQTSACLYTTSQKNTLGINILMLCHMFVPPSCSRCVAEIAASLRVLPRRAQRRAAEGREEAVA
jgi:hypothetical protein